MSSYDITFCKDVNCSKKDCRRHHLKAIRAFEEGAIQLSFCSDWREEKCNHYWEDDEGKRLLKKSGNMQ